MPDRKTVRIDGKDYDAANVPPWYDHVLPAIGDPKTQREAEENDVRNRRGSEVAGAILIGILVVLVLVAGALVVLVLRL